MPMPCILFEDEFAGRLRPMNLARPSCRITCGAYTLEQLLGELDVSLSVRPRPHLLGVCEASDVKPAKASRGQALYVNAALVPDLATVERLRELAEAGKPFLALNDQRVTSALAPDGFPEELSRYEDDGADVRSHLLGSRLPVVDDIFPMLDYTFDHIGHHERLFESHLEKRIAAGGLTETKPGVHLGKDVTVAENVVFDAADGPVVVEDGVSIQPFSYVAGPVRLGKGSRIIDHASIKHGASVGHTCKVGGEVEAVVIEPYSNKQHHGFLGHSWVGSWVNLGAGTSNSDLKNTYGPISLDVDGQTVPTGRLFVGAVIGDYSKTAINTSILTGKTIGVASFVYGVVSTNVASFTNYARSFGQVTEVDVAVALKTQQRAARRRKVDVGDMERRLFRDLFALTAADRAMIAEQVVL